MIVPAFAEGVWSSVTVQVPYLEMFQEWGPLLSVPISFEIGSGALSGRTEFGWAFNIDGPNSCLFYGSVGARVYSKDQGRGLFFELSPVYRSYFGGFNYTKNALQLDGAVIIGYSGTIAGRLGWGIIAPVVIYDAYEDDRYALPNVGITLRYKISGENN